MTGKLASSSPNKFLNGRISPFPNMNRIFILLVNKW